MLTWDPPLPEDQNGVIIGYIINITTLTFTTASELISVDSQSHKLTVRAYSTYNISVAAKTSEGTGPFTEAITVNTPQDGELIVE